MIRIVKKGEKLSGEDLVGRWVLQEGQFVFPTYRAPRVVVGYTAASLRVEKVEMERFRNEDGTPNRRFTDDGEREPAEMMRISSVACICDTAADVNRVVAVGSEIIAVHAEAMRRLEADLRGRLDALDGTGEPTPEPESSPRI